ncbi:hypothetical protein HK100_002157 [Physocladia obscura]|uniref:Uncharacterized protein n=1 Tax=Physocladia obscura TaxID=109957 RepID=A0AAD5SYC2_9FUNG|nr:hypothetical protein HK100_002157 [Physocladia obscura]
MQLISVISLVATVANAVSLQVGTPATAPDTLACTYLVNFADGVDTLSSIESHFAQFPDVTYSIRTHVSNQYANFASFQIHGTCYESQVSSIASSISYSTVRSRKAPKPIKFGALTSRDSTVYSEDIHSITGVNEVREKYGAFGRGIQAAIVDTGIYYLHPALGGGFGPGFKVAGGYDLVGDNYYSGNTTTVPDPDPFDNCSAESHGTHVAGIIAGNATDITVPGFVPAVQFTGVAPQATLYAYRIFGCDADSTGTDVIAAGLYLAAGDGADVINLSVGGGPTFAEDPDQIAAATISAAGHLLFQAAGNDGGSGPYSVGSTSPGSFAVASFDNVEIPSDASLILDGAAYPITFSISNSIFTDGETFDILVNDIMANDTQSLTDGCSLASINNSTSTVGKALVFRYGSGCGTSKRCGNAAAVGATACIIYNLLPTGMTGNVLIPGFEITTEAAAVILSDAKADITPSAVFSSASSSVFISTAGTVSAFSSVGLSPDLLLKPDVGGIGGQVYSTISPHAAESQGLSIPYAIYSGTSMATPYTLGVAALILELRGSIGFEGVRAFLKNNAQQTKIYGTDLINSPAVQGAGLVNAYTAVTANTLVLPSSISLNDTANIKNSYTITIYNNYAVDVVYSLSVNNAATANPYIHGDDFTQDYYSTTYTDDSHPTIQFSASTVAIPAKASADITVSFTPPTPTYDDLYPIYGGYINVANNQDNITASVPFAGVAGSWADKSIFSVDSASLYANFGELAADYTPYGIFGVVPNSVSTGLYADVTFTPLVVNQTVDVSSGAAILAPIAATTRKAQIILNYLGNDGVFIDAGFSSNSAIVDVLYYSPSAGTFYEGGPFTGEWQRNAFSDDQSIVAPYIFVFEGNAWDINNNLWGLNPIFVPNGLYNIQFWATKNFGDPNNPDNYQVTTSPQFLIVGGATPITTTSPTSSYSTSTVGTTSHPTTSVEVGTTAEVSTTEDIGTTSDIATESLTATTKASATASLGSSTATSGTSVTTSGSGSTATSGGTSTTSSGSTVTSGSAGTGTTSSLSIATSGSGTYTAPTVGSTTGYIATYSAPNAGSASTSSSGSSATYAAPTAVTSTTTTIPVNLYNGAQSAVGVAFGLIVAAVFMI